MSTTCEFPPELDDLQLIAYLDDPETNQETARHLEGCQHCRAKAGALDRFQKRLTTRLYRSTCPSPMELGEFHLGMLRASQRLYIGQHLRECPHCAQETSQLEGYLGDLSRPGLLATAKVFIAQLVSGREAIGAPDYAGLRGEGEGPVLYQADDIPIMIQVHDDMEKPGLRSLLGLVAGLKAYGFMMEAYQQGNLINTTFIDEIGNFLFTHLPPGFYDLILLGPHTEIRIPSLEV